MHQPRFPALFLILLAVASTVARPASAPAEQGTDDLVAAKLLADTSVVRPGEAFTLGVRLQIKPGWHVYWQNPGDSGRPTRVKFTAPPGFTVGELRYPVPEKFTQSDGAAVYGYSRSVLLTARITPPADAKDVAPTAAKAAFAAEVSWLCCEDLCVPGKSKCALELPFAAGGSAAPGASENQKLFVDWENRVPVPLGEKGAPASGSPVVEPSKDAAICSIVLHWDAPPARVECFPAPEDAVKVSHMTVAPTKAGETRVTQVRFRAEILKGQKWSGRNLPVVVACQDGKGAWRGVRVEFPLEQSGSK